MRPNLTDDARERSRRTAWAWATAPDSFGKRAMLASILPDLPDDEAAQHWLAASLMAGAGVGLARRLQQQAEQLHAELDLGGVGRCHIQGLEP